MHHAEMTRNSFRHGGKFMIDDPEFPAGLFHDPADGRVMYMTDTGKKMMFHLVVQSPDIPGNEFILRSKIGRGLYLVDSPLRLQLHRIVLFDIYEFRMFY